jgi:predicted HD phosphohydrolase
VPGYEAALSDDSKRSLALQGGVFDAAQAAAFIARPGAAEALRLRRWDDLAKTAGAATPPLAHFLARAARCAHEASPGLSRDASAHSESPAQSGRSGSAIG